MAVVLDATAMIAYARDEEGTNFVERLLLDENQKCIAHAINICELFYDSLRLTDESTALAVIADFLNNGLIIHEDLDTEFWKMVGRYKVQYKISLADCCGLALANRLHADFITADHHEMDSLLNLGICTIRFIR